MNFTTAMLIAGASGFVAAGLLATILRPGVRRGWVLASGLGGAALGAVTCGLLLLLDLVLSFGDLPSAANALMLTLLIEGLAVGSALVATRLQGSLVLPESVDALIESTPEVTPAKAWLIGVGIASLLVYFGVECAATATATVGTTMWHRDVHGVPAVLYGIGWIAIGMFIHFHYVWTRHERLQTYSTRAKKICVVVASVSLTIAFYGAIRPVASA